jgi:hypothetical protein
VDVLDIKSNELSDVHLSVIGEQLKTQSWWPQIARSDYEASKRCNELGLDAPELWVLTFEEFLKGDFPRLMRSLLQTLEEAYSYPVDTEFTVNFDKKGNYRINLLQCRPLQTNKTGQRLFQFDFMNLT